MLKKFVSVIIIAVMLLSMVTVFVSYAESTEMDEAKDFLSILGIVASDVTNADAEISREEFAFMLAKALKLEKYTGNKVRYFKDVEYDSYAVDEINALAEHQIISVPDNREFRPEETILFEEICKMIVCALDYEMIAESRGGYPVGYVRTAVSFDMATGGIGKTVSYGEAYTILFQTMLASLPRVNYVKDNGEVMYKANSEESILSEYWDIYSKKGTLDALYGMSMTADVVAEKNRATVDGVPYLCADEVNLDTLFGGYVEVFYQKAKSDRIGSIVYARKQSIKEDIAIQPKNLLDVNVNEVVYFDANNSKRNIKLTKTKVIYNGKPLESNIKETLMNINKGSIVVKDSDNDGYYDLIVVKDYRNFLVSNINEEKVYNRLQTGDILNFDDYDCKRIFNGNVATDDDIITVGNILSVAESVDGEVVEVIISTNELTGEISQINSAGNEWYFTVNGSKYLIEKSYAVSLLGSDGQKQSSLLLGKQYKIKLDSFGNIAYLESLTQDMKVGVILKGAEMERAFGETVRIMLLTQDGIFEELEFDKKIVVNGEKQRDGGKKMLDEILTSSDKLIRYTVDEDGTINNLITAVYDQRSNYDGKQTRAIYSGLEKQWYNSARLGTAALLTKDTPIFMIPYGDANPDIEDCAVLSYSSLIDNVNHYGNAYHYNKESVAADAAVIYYEYGNLYDNIDMYRPVIMFSSMEKRLNEDMMTEHILIGYTKGGKVEYIVPDTISFAGIKEGDMIMLNHGINGKVVEGAKLFASDVEVVCKVDDIMTNKKPAWNKNAHHDYLYANSNDTVSRYYREDFQMSFGYVCKVSGTQVAWGYQTGENFSEAANITGNIVMYDSSRDDGEKIFIGNAADLVTYDVAGYDCSKIIFRTRGGRMWETFCYNE